MAKKRLLSIYIAFSLSFILILIISILFFVKFNLILEVSNEVERAYHVKNLILRIQSYLIEAENNQRGFLITNDKDLLQPFSQTQKSIFSEIEELKGLTRDNPEQQQIVIKLKQIVSLRYQVLYQTLDHDADVQRDRFLQSANKGKIIMQQFRDLANDMDRVESKVLEEKTKSKQTLEVATPKYLLLILFISLFFLIASFLVIMQAYRRRRQHQEQLENKINELNSTNAELEQIAFVASHDLQEPLRKIRTYSDKLIKQHKSVIDEAGQVILDKMAISSKRMQELLNDLINYIRLVKNEETLQYIDLNKVVESVCKNLFNTIDYKKARITIGELPPLNGFYKQLYLLLYNLIDNALKFSNQEITPEITISSTRVSGAEIDMPGTFMRISIADNGIGFKKEFAQKIFVIFQRLHMQNSPYHGRGIGLAMCKRVMSNHKGIIVADGETGEGATFHLYFPEKPGE